MVGEIRWTELQSKNPLSFHRHEKRMYVMELLFFIYKISIYSSSSQSSGTESLIGKCAGDTVRERLDPAPPKVELLEAGTTSDKVGFGANTEEEGWVLVLAADVDIDAPEVTTEVHPRCVCALEDPWAAVVVFHDLAIAGGTGRQDGEEDEEDWVLALTALKSASFPRP